MASIICLVLFRSVTIVARDLALLTAVKSNDARMPMIAMITNNSIKVNPLFLWQLRFTPLQTVHSDGSYCCDSRCHLTLQISDPAPLILDCQPERHRRVHCIWFVRLTFHSSRM
jgi:hypothetical protein